MCFCFAFIFGPRGLCGLRYQRLLDFCWGFVFFVFGPTVGWDVGLWGLCCLRCQKLLGVGPSGDKSTRHPLWGQKHSSPHQSTQNKASPLGTKTLGAPFGDKSNLACIEALSIERPLLRTKALGAPFGDKSSLAFIKAFSLSLYIYVYIYIGPIPQNNFSGF